MLRTDLSNNPTFRELLSRVREVTLGAYAHQDLPFEKLVEELQPARDLSRPPLFQVMFVLHNAPATALQVPGLVLTPLETPNETSLFDITLSITETEQGLRGWREYNTDLFDEATIAHMAGHYQTLLEGIAADPRRRLSDLPLLNEAERRHALAVGCAAPTDYQRDCCIHQLFEEQAERTPDALAVVFDRRPTNDERPTTNDQRRTRRQGDKETRGQGDKGREQSTIYNLQSPRATDNGRSILHPPSSILSA